MIKHFLFSLLILISCAAHAQSGGQRGDLVSFIQLDSLDQQEILALYTSISLPPFLAPINYDIELYKVVYRTPAARGDSLTSASGLAMFPVNDSLCFPLLNYNHGTYFYGDELSTLGFEWFLGVPMTTGGYVMSMPDYLGYGETPLDHPHPYLHSQTEASASIDMMRATRQLCQIKGVGLSEEVFLGGYSQGGHVTLATQREIEANLSSEFKLVAVGAGGGPYDMSQTTRNEFLSGNSGNSFFLGFIMTSYQFVYGDLWQNPSEAFVSPYDSLLPLYFDRTVSPRPNVQFPSSAIDMIQGTYIQNAFGDSLHPINVAIRDNDLLNWKPENDLRLYYCEADEIVPFKNALIALDSFVARGATQVSAISIDPNLDHASCSIPTFLQIKLWFDGLRQSCVLPFLQKDSLKAQVKLDSLATAAVQAGLITRIKVFPNPANTEAFVYIPEKLGISSISLTNAQGQEIRQIEVNSSTTRGSKVRLDLNALSKGIYWVRIALEGQRLYLPLVKKE